jgi:hypothetical protein
MKLAPKNLKKDKTVTQYCIDGYLVNEVLDDLPTGVTIIGAKVLIGSVHQRHKIVVPNRMKRLGVQMIQESVATQQATLVFDQVSKTVIKSKVAQVSRSMGVDPNLAFFKYITLQVTDATGKFEHCTKEIKPDETDLRKKLRVLGLEDAEGEVKNLIKVLSAKKYMCTIQHEQVRTIICSNMS